MTTNPSPDPTGIDAGPGSTRAGSRARRFLWYWAPVFAYLAVIFAGSSMSHLPPVPGGFSDKVAHASEYAVLGLLLARALAGPRWLSITLRYVIGAIVLATLYGVSDEIHQLFVPDRDFDVKDMAADALGASLSACALWGWGIIRRFSARPTTATSNQ